MKLIKTFEDEYRHYFLLELVRGVQLAQVVKHLRSLTEEDARFYAGCLLLVLEYLHERDVLYRDLKSANVIIDEEGYPKLVDFGCAKVANGRAFTIVGTPHYMAPEVISGKGHGPAADYWSLGVLLYEMLCEALPFGEGEDNPYIVYQRVLQQRVAFPHRLLSKSLVRGLIEQLLSRNPAQRGTPESLKKHRWFEGINWHRLGTRTLRPPFNPKMNEVETSGKSEKSLQQVLLDDEVRLASGHLFED